MTNNKVLTPISLIPKSINDTILEFLKRPADKTTFSAEGDSIKVQKIIDNTVMSIEITEYADGNTITQSVFKNNVPKSDYENTIKELAKNGMKNKDIASLLGMDPSYVSRLKNRKEVK